MQKPSKIVQSAIRANEVTIPGLFHYDHFMTDIMMLLDVGMQWTRKDRFENGYIDQSGKFYSESEAIILSIENKMIPENFDRKETLSHVLWNKENPRIVCAALFHDSYTFLSPNYFDDSFNNWMKYLPAHDYWRQLPKEHYKKGFIDSCGMFHDPLEALYIAREAKQLSFTKTFPTNQLTVEDLY